MRTFAGLIFFACLGLAAWMLLTGTLSVVALIDGFILCASSTIAFEASAPAVTNKVRR